MVMHNADSNNKWKMGINKFSDLTTEEKKLTNPVTAM